ncbi:MAG: hypothetical protein NVS2B16_03410 [Chloroflexota bacterium]
MIIEQIRYFLDAEDTAPLVEARRQVTRVRKELGLPPGHILIADAGPERGPCIVWQCGYEDESQMGMAETRLIGDPNYEAARTALASLVTEIEVELYLIDDEEAE